MITEEHRKNLSESHKGIKRTEKSLKKFRITMRKKWADPKFKAKMSTSHMGHPVSMQTKKKISIGHITISQEQEKRIIALYLGGYTGGEIIKKLEINRSIIYGCLRRNKIELRKGGFQKGLIPWNYGLKFTKEQKRKLNLKGLELGRAWNKGIPASGEQVKKMMEGLQKWCNKNGHYPNWRGGISFEPYGLGFNDKLKEQIRQRDNYRCQSSKCGIKQNGRAHDVHHITYDKKDNRKINLITLCNRCHLRTNGNRDYWKVYFQELMIIRGIL